MKKFTCILSFIFILSFNAFTQEQYIEVLVKDTLIVEPQRWILLIKIEKQYDYVTSDTISVIDSVAAPSTSIEPTYPKEEEMTSSEVIKNLVKKFKGTVLDDSTNPYNYYSSIYSRSVNETSLRAEFSNRKAMDEFLVAASAFPDVHSLITDTYHSDLQRFHGQLESKLMNAAKQKAMRLAQLSGRKAGMVILISEATQSENNTIQELINTLIKYDGFESKRMAFMNFYPDKIKLEKMLKVRFALQ
jgi:hypothetical protein